MGESHQPSPTLDWRKPMTLTAKEKRVRAEVFQPYAKKIADGLCSKQGWDTYGTFGSYEVSTLILQIIKSLMDKDEFVFDGVEVRKNFEVYKPEGRQQIAQIWREIAANLSKT